MTAQIEIMPEDQARAGWYALLARLLADGPDEKLMQAIAGADEMVGADDDAPLARAWAKLQQAAAMVPAEDARAEHQTLFVGVGASEVSPYGTHYAQYIEGTQFLVALRCELGKLGLATHPGSSQSEDHVAAIMDVMRFLAAGDAETPPADVALQGSFFQNFVASWYGKFFEAVQQSGTANFYKRVAEFAQAFFAAEAESFEM
ncbi:MAG: molecular chaperone TorD family protein [Burkholderiales bacterium]